MEMFRGGRKILIGDHRLNDVLSGYKKVFLVCDPFLVENKGYTYISDRLEKLGIEYELYSHIEPDPDTMLVAEGVEALRAFSPDMIVAMGGGSAIDAAKAMMYFSRLAGMEDKPNFIAVPTTSGTGSEVTDFSVITNKDKGIKYPLVDELMLPDIAVLDATLTLSVPKNVTAVTGMDVLTHAIEALVSTAATDFSDAAAEKAIKLIRSYLYEAYINPDNLEARQGMHNASCLAGIAFNNAGLGLNHAMAHALGGEFHIPHGMANALLLPYVMGFNAGCYDGLNENAKLYAKIARLIKVDAPEIRTSAFNLIRTIKHFKQKLQIPATIKELGINKNEFNAALDKMSEAAANDKCLATNPRRADVADIRQLFIHAYTGRNGVKVF